VLLVPEHFLAQRPQDSPQRQLISEGGARREYASPDRSLADLVTAHRYVDTQQKTGNVVLTVDGSGT
jgi:hypothetical protein